MNISKKGKKMKIRTNFVTNSSSYSSAEIKIDNPVLLEILEKYRDLGAFIRDDGDEDFDLGWIIGSNECNGEAPVALYFNDPEQAEIMYAPDSIEDVVNHILDVIVNEWDRDKLKNESLFKECENELKARAEEINESYREVSWEASNDGYGECEPEEGEETSWEFYY